MRFRLLIRRKIERLLGRRNYVRRKGVNWNFCHRTDAIFGISHRVIGTAEFGKARIAFHSDFRAGASIWGNSKFVAKNPETYKNERTNMMNTEYSNNDAKNMGNRIKTKGKLLFLILCLVAPLVWSAYKASLTAPCQAGDGWCHSIMEDRGGRWNSSASHH